MDRSTTIGFCHLYSSWRRWCWLLVFCVVVHVSQCQNDTVSDAYDNTLAKGAKQSNSGHSLETHDFNQTRELDMTIEEDSLQLKMSQERKIRASFTLYCTHPSITYAIQFSTGNTNVAKVDTTLIHNITCARAEPVPVPNAQPTGSHSTDPKHKHAEDGHNENLNRAEEQTIAQFLPSVKVVRGDINFTLTADLLGRTWLHVLGERRADPEAVLPDFLVLPWEEPQSLNLGSTRTLLNDTLSSPTEHPTDTSLISDGGSEPPYSVFNGKESEATHELQKHVVTVIRVPKPLDMTFRAVLYAFVMLSTVGMGCKTDLSVVKKVLKKPVAPAIGFFCQYLIMPLIAFMLAKTLVVGDPAVSLGIFACGICPGGGASNMFSYLLDGDVSLSVTMTAISSLAALAMIPLWLFTLGAKFEDDKIALNVPFVRIIITLALIIIPLFIGLLIKRCLPKVAKWVLKILKPFTLLAILFLVTFGIYANIYVFRLFSLRTLLAGCMLPYIGYTLGVIISLILRQPCPRVKTIAIETGIQNTSIAYLLLIFSLPAPDGDMAAVGPMASALMTPLPLLLLVLVYLAYKRFCKKKEEGKDGKANHEGNGNDEEEGVALTDGIEGNGKKNGI